MFKSISRMKPAPRFIVIALLVGLPAWGIKAYLDSRPAKPVEVAAPVVETTTVPAEGTAPTQVATEAPAPTPVQAAPAAGEPAPGLTPANSNNSGLEAVLRQGQK